MSYFRPPDKTTWIEGRVKKPKLVVITNRMAHEEAAGYGLCDQFFRFNGIDPDATYTPPKEGKLREE